MENKKNHRATIKTLLYADLFSYPLTKEEIWKWLIWEENFLPNKKDFEKYLNSSKIPEVEGFFHLPGKEKIVSQRKNKKNISKAKIEKAKKITNSLKKIPTIKLIGISGTLAMENSERNDDIDLFLITKANTLWLTRLLSTILLELKSVRRRPNDVNVKDKICPNMLMDEISLTIPQNEQNLYTAHEVCQMLPLWEKDNTYEKFLSANLWVKNYLPNAIPEVKENHSSKKNFISRILEFGILALSEVEGWILEFFIMSPQLWYMKSHRTKEVIKKEIIRFHPKDRSKRILKSYYKGLKKLQIM